MFQYPFGLDSYFYLEHIRGQLIEGAVFQYPFGLDSYFYKVYNNTFSTGTMFQYPFGLDSYFYGWGDVKYYIVMVSFNTLSG